MSINVNELILDRVRSLRLTDLTDGSVVARLTKLEDPSLQTSAESEDVTDALGSLITRLFRAKTGRFSTTNSLFSADLYALQLGTTKEVATSSSKIPTPIEEIITIPASEVTADGDGTTHTPHIKLSHKPIAGTLKFAYGFERNQLAKKYKLDHEITTLDELSEKEENADKFLLGIGETDAQIVLPHGTTGKIYVEYEYEAAEAVRIKNNTENFPEAVGVVIDCIFRDQCNENIKYAGSVVATKGKIDPSQIEIALTTTGKHPLDIDFFKDYCDEDADLFSVIIAGDETTPAA